MTQYSKENAPPLSRTEILIALIIGILALALYIRTLAPSLLWGDSAEFQTLSYTLGMTHPTGYVTQIVFGKIFTLIPINNIAWRVNLMSAFFGALAVADTFLIVLLLIRQHIPALAAALLLALTPGFWWYAIIAESKAPAAGMFASVWLFFLLWRKTEKSIFLFIAGLIGAVSLGIHSTVVMSAASVLIVMAAAARNREEWLNAAAGALLGAALFLAFFFFLDHHDPPSSIYNVGFRPNLSAVGLSVADFDSPFKRFLFIFPAGHFWSFYFTASAQEIHRRLVEYVALFPIWGIVLTILGAGILFLNGNWREGIYPLISFLLIWGFGVTVSFSVYQEYYVPAIVITSVWFGVGAGMILSVAGKLMKQNQMSAGLMRIAIMCGLLILPTWNARDNLSLAVREGYTIFVRQNHIYPIFRPNKAIQDADKIIRRIEPNGIVLSDWDKVYSLVYTAQIEDKRRDITFHEAWITDDQVFSKSMLTYINANIDKRPIYLTVDMPGMYDLYNVTKLDDGFFQLTRK